MDNSRIETIESVLSGKSAAQIKDLLVELCQKIPDAYQLALLWEKTAMKERYKKRKAFLEEMRALE
jgi:hypothetical protein